MAANAPPLQPDDTRQRLLAAAEVVFAERGFDSATVRDICRAAGANVAAIHYHFGDKERLYVETLKQAHECADDGPAGQLPQWPPGTPPVEKLTGFIRFMLGRMHAPARPSALRLLMREIPHPSPAAREVILRYIRPKAFALRDILAELLPGARPRRLLMTGFSVIGQILFYRQNRPVAELIFGKDQVDALDLAAVTDHVTRFTLAALGLGPPYRFGEPSRE
jgi:AcrR family transcriptional regulator